MENNLEKRMYFFVVSSLSNMSKGIMCGHAALEYVHMYGQSEDYIDFINNWKTWIILEGGTTNDLRNFDGISEGTINQIGDELADNDTEFSYYREPDLNNAITALCFICDERVFNNIEYPDFNDWLLDENFEKKTKNEKIDNGFQTTIGLRIKSYEELQEMFPELHKEWIRNIGGIKNVFLRELIRR